MERLLNDMSSTFNQNSEEEPQIQINLNEDNTLKWRGLHNNSYASNKRRTRKSAKEGITDDRQGGAPATADPVESGKSTTVAKSERVLRRTRTSSEVVEAKREKTHANGSSTATTTTTTNIIKPKAMNVVVISTKSNKDKEQPTKDNNVEELVQPKLDDKTVVEGKATAAGVEVSAAGHESKEGNSVSPSNGDSTSQGSIETRHSKRVTRRRTSAAGKDDTLPPTTSLKRKLEEDGSEKKPQPEGEDFVAAAGEDQSTSAINPPQSTSLEEKKPRLLMKIRTDNKSITIVKTTDNSATVVDTDDPPEQQEHIQPGEVVEDAKEDNSTAITEPKRRGRKPGTALKSKFGEKLKILPKRTGVRGQLSPERSPPQQLSQQRPSRRIKPTPKILENEELRHGFEQQNSARLLGLNGEWSLGCSADNKCINVVTCGR